MKIDIKSYNLTELEEYFKNINEPRFRAGQLFDWLHVKLAKTFDEMSNLPKSLIARLDEGCELRNCEIEALQISKEDGTRKYAFRLNDGNIIESVFMRYEHGNSVCVSSQVGCRMGCKFCASTIDGLCRNLTASEILEQVYAIGRDTGERISNVVIMGSGEPLDNYDNVVKFIRLINEEKGYKMSQRNITLSTCGIVPMIYELAKENLQITLAISLHAPNDELRRKTMPIATKYSISEILEATDWYFEKTGRRISFEYTVIKDLNDDKSTILELASLLSGRSCHVNLISINPIKERDYKRESELSLKDIKKVLENKGISATIRRRLGADIDSACGQLRRRVKSDI